MWEFEAPTTPGELDEKIDILITAIRPVASAIASPEASCDIRLVIVYDGWVGNSSLGAVQLDAESTRVLAEAGGALEVDIYAHGPSL